MFFIAPVAFISNVVVSFKSNAVMFVSPASFTVMLPITVPTVMFSSTEIVKSDIVGIVSGILFMFIVTLLLRLTPAWFVAFTSRR